MLLTLLSAGLGFFTSLVPEIIRLFKDKADKAHELALLDKQLEFSKAASSQKIQEIKVQGEQSEIVSLIENQKPIGVPWVDALSASVRPVITYCFFIVFAIIKILSLYYLMDTQGLIAVDAFKIVWDEESQALFTAIIAFWFGSRAINKRK